MPINHVVAGGADLRTAALHLQRLGFAISRVNHETHLRIVMEQGYIDLFEDEGPWRWRRAWLRGLSRAAGPGTDDLRLLPEGAGIRPQDDMEPGRAAAVVAHANTSIELTGVWVLVADAAASAAGYAAILGGPPAESVDDSALGVTGSRFRLEGGHSIVVVSATYGTGVAERFLHEQPLGIFALAIRVQSEKAAAEALRQSGVYSFRSEGRLVTSNALPGLGLLLFEAG